MAVDITTKSVAVLPEPIDTCARTVTGPFDLQLKTLQEAGTKRFVDWFFPSHSFAVRLIELLFVEIVLSYSPRPSRGGDCHFPVMPRLLTTDYIVPFAFQLVNGEF